MRTLQIFLIFTFLMSSTITVDAQFGRLKRRLQNKIERKIDQKIDEKMDKAVDEAFEGNPEEESNNTDNNDVTKNKKKRKYDLSNISMEEIELTNTYHFSKKIDWLMTSNRQDEPTEVSQLMSKDGNFAMMVKDTKSKSTQGTMIFDISKEYLIILTEEQKQAMVMSMDATETLADNVDAQQSDMKITATGKQKKILGYSCKQYIFTSSEAKGDMWVTEDLKLKNHNLFAYLKKMSRKKSKSTPAGWEKIEEGFVLEMNSTDNDGNASNMKVTAINLSVNINYDMKKYQAINMTGFGGLMGN